MIWTMRLMDTATYCLSIVIYLYPIKYFTLSGCPDGILRAASFLCLLRFRVVWSPARFGPFLPPCPCRPIIIVVLV
jgi:hypothetical protein